jgi:hypothetical protein
MRQTKKVDMAHDCAGSEADLPLQRAERSQTLDRTIQPDLQYEAMGLLPDCKQLTMRKT